MKWLTKSDYLKYLVHPAYLWLAKYAKDKLPEPDEGLRAVLEQGNLIDAEARKLFPGGQLVDAAFSQHHLVSADLMKPGGPEVLFQPSILSKRNLYVRADILRRAGSAWDLYEVKATTKVKPEHLDDLAFQQLAITEAGYQVGRVYVVHLNNQYVRQGSVNPGQLFMTVDVTDQVEPLLAKTAGRVEAALGVLGARECPDDAPQLAGDWGRWRGEYRHLHPDVPADSVLNLCRLKIGQIKALAAAGITRLVDIPDDFELGPEQRTQVEVTRSGQARVQYEQIAHELSGLRYPLYFLDYETFTGAIPLWDGLRPYQQLPFQYSLHVVAEPGGAVEHREFLARGTNYPVPELLEHLAADLGDTGTVLVWNESFEKGCNDAMGALHPEYREFLESVNARVYDLMTPFAQGLYADARFLGSASIKAVLPVLVPGLSYKELSIGNGAAAQIRWMACARGEVTGAAAEQVYADLVTYCGQDTMAMVRILEYLQALKSAIIS